MVTYRSILAQVLNEVKQNRQIDIDKCQTRCYYGKYLAKEAKPIVAQIEVRLNNLLAQIELETGERPTQRDIANAIGVAESTLSRLAQGKTGRFDGELLAKLIDYLDERLEDGCTLADLLVYPPVRGQEIAPRLVPA